ncbi:MAG TPA: Na+/H+ antiporter NhaA [Vicinamibacterales bacterium]|jgi:NhaA family Na+:H+ antiporter|nr:Na+/H+ antiporter NhaA [Vicinamibacterales bacterium]
MKRAARFLRDQYLVLPIGAILALVWANTGSESYFRFAHTLAFAVNDVGMALFFGVVTHEIVEAMMPGGALHSWRRAILPVVAALGGIGGSALAYVAFVRSGDETLLLTGWPVGSAIDVAFCYFTAKIIFRKRAATPFLLLLAIATNVVVLAVVMAQYPVAERHLAGLALMAVAIGVAVLLRWQRVASFWPYLLIGGTLSWTAFLWFGVNPALALVPIVPLQPHAPRGLDFFAGETRGVHVRSGHFEHVFELPVQVVLFLFGLVNGGLLIRGWGTGSWAVVIAALVGRPIGVWFALAASTRLRLLPRLHWRDQMVIALVSSTGFMFALFVATAVFPPGPVLIEVKLGAVSTCAAVALAIVAARVLRVGRFSDDTVASVTTNNQTIR